VLAHGKSPSAPSTRPSDWSHNRCKTSRSDKHHHAHRSRKAALTGRVPSANQFRLLIHTAAYWLLHTLRGLAPKTSFWRNAQFDTIRLALIKIAARVTELKPRIKVALPSCYRHQTSWALLATRTLKLPP
jgi:hypothetical protein